MSKVSHPAEDLLFRSFNGELGEAESNRIEQHLNECWECRTRWEQWHLARADYMLYRRETQDTVPPPPSGWGRFHTRLHEAAHELGAPKHHALFHSDAAPAASWWRIAGGVAAALAVAAGLLVYFERPQTVSAAEILTRVASEEKAGLAASGQVAHRVITIEERSHAMGQVVARRRVDSWQAADRKRMARRVFTDTGRLLAGEWSRADGSRVSYEKPQTGETAERGILGAGSLWRLAPSAEDFQAATTASGATSVEVSADHYLLRYRAAATGARTLYATLTVRRSDAHAVEQTLGVQQQDRVDEFHYVEDSFDSRAENQLSAAVFQPDSELAPANAPAFRAAAPEEPAAHDAALPEPRNGPAGTGLELDVLDRLDRADALLDNNIQVTRAPDGGLKIEGIVAGPERRAELLESLGPLAQNRAIHISVLTPQEAQGLQTAPQGPVSLQQVEIDQSRTPADPELRVYFSARGAADVRQAIAQFSSSAIEHAVQAQLQAHVIKLVSTKELSGLDDEHRSQWLSLIHRHAGVVQRELSTLRRQLQPVFAARTPTAIPPAADSDLLSMGSRLFELVSQIDDQVRRSFSASGTPQAVVPVKDASFWELLANAEAISASVSVSSQMK